MNPQYVRNKEIIQALFTHSQLNCQENIAFEILSEGSLNNERDIETLTLEITNKKYETIIFKWQENKELINISIYNKGKTKLIRETNIYTTCLKEMRRFLN